MLLSAEHLSINFGSRQLLSDVNFYLNEGDKTGIIGINGTGKSTFLKVLAGLTEPDGGTVSRNPNVQVSILSQNPVMEDNATVLADSEETLDLIEKTLKEQGFLAPLQDYEPDGVN